jgi:uncharacterized protein (TIGR02145 family)
MKNIIYQVLFLLFFPLLSFSQEQVKLLTSTKFNNGEQIPEAKTASEWEQLSMSNQPVFMKKLVNGTEFYFYNWYAISDNRGIVNEKWMIPCQNEIIIWNAYSPIEITPIGIISEQGAFTKVSDQQYFWTTSEYFEKGKRESAVSVSISNSTIGETELKQAYKQEGFLVLVVETEKMKATTKSVAQTILNNNKISSPIASQPTKIEKENETNKMKPKVIDSNNKTVSIGSQIWMSENLNVDRFRNGDLIPEAKTKDEWIKAYKEGKPVWHYIWNDSTSECGKVYNFYAVNDSRGLAPEGYHIPSDAEWIILITYLGGEKKAGKKMKSKSGWFENGNGTNSSGFSGLACGFAKVDGLLEFGTSLLGIWWSSTGNTTYSIGYDFDKIMIISSSNSNLSHVRCIKD